MVIKVKICFFNSCRFWGGGEKWHFETALLMKENGHDVVICSSKNSELSLKAKKSGIRVEEFNITNLSFINLMLMNRLRNFFSIEKFDVIILNLPADLKSAGVAAKSAGIRKIVYRRGSAIPVKNSLLNRIIFKNVVGSIIANSVETKNTVLKNNAQLFPEEKIYHLYNGIDIEEYEKREFQNLYKKTEYEIVIGNGGRLSKQKNQIFLIKMAEQLKKEGLKFKILIAGKGELEESLKSEAKLRGVEEEVIFLGFVENIKSFMKSIDIFLLPSHWEGFGYVMVEAMLCRKPVIAFNISSNPEIVEDGESGFLIEKDNIEECIKKIKLFAENPEEINRMGAKGEEYSKLKFSIKEAVKKLEEILNK